MPDDPALLLRAADGDGEAWRALVELHAPYAWDLARRRLRRGGADPALAEDLLQEVWTALLANGGRNLRRIDPERGLKPYLAAAVLNAVRNRVKKSARQEARERDHAPLPSAPGVPEEPLLRGEASEALARGLERLEPEDRLILRWIYWDGMSYDEAAALMGMKPSGLGPHLGRVRARLREALEGNREKGSRRGEAAL